MFSNKLLNVLVTAMFSCKLCLGQLNFIKSWDYRYGGTYIENLAGVIPGIDGGYLICGPSYSLGTGDVTKVNYDTTGNTQDFWILKINQQGMKEWDKSYGGADSDVPTALCSNGEYYFVGGTTKSDSSGDISSKRIDTSYERSDYWIVKLSLNGQKIWERRIGGFRADVLKSIVCTPDGGCLAIGHSNSGVSGDITTPSNDTLSDIDYWAIKLDSNGNKLWDRRYGGTDNDIAYVSAKTSDGGYIISGSSSSGVGDEKSEPSWNPAYSDAWIIKVDSVGNKLWDKTLGTIYPDNVNCMLEDPSGNVYFGIATTGNGGSFTDPSIGPVFSTGDYLLYKIDAFGNKIWDKRYGGTGSDVLRHLSLSSKGEILLTGASKSPISGNKTEANLAEVEIWVLAVDSSGTVLWDKTIHNTGTNFEIYGATYATEDGCYTTFEYTNSGIGGYKSQSNWDSTNAATDIWAIQYCFDTISGFTKNFGYALATLHPNPASTTITLSGTEPGSTATITNLHGQVLLQLTVNNQQQSINIEHLPPGMYFCIVQTGGQRKVLRFVRQ